MRLADAHKKNLQQYIAAQEKPLYPSTTPSMDEEHAHKMALLKREIEELCGKVAKYRAVETQFKSALIELERAKVIIAWMESDSSGSGNRKLTIWIFNFF